MDTFVRDWLGATDRGKANRKESLSKIHQVSEVAFRQGPSRQNETRRPSLRVSLSGPIDMERKRIMNTKSVDSSLLESIRSLPPGSDLELLAKPCGDCAVTCGFYREHSDAFKAMPKDEQLARSKKWFCHNARDRACRGHADNIGMSW